VASLALVTLVRTLAPENLHFSDCVESTSVCFLHRGYAEVVRFLYCSLHQTLMASQPYFVHQRFEVPETVSTFAFRGHVGDLCYARVGLVLFVSYKRGYRIVSDIQFLVQDIAADIALAA
jgi:hypothetical protein